MKPWIKKLLSGATLTTQDIHDAGIEGAGQRLRPHLMTVSAVLAIWIPILWESGISSDVMEPIAAPIFGGMITSTFTFSYWNNRERPRRRREREYRAELVDCKHFYNGYRAQYRIGGT